MIDESKMFRVAENPEDVPVETNSNEKELGGNNDKDRVESGQRDWREITTKVQRLYLDLAEQYLDGESTLKQRITDFYSDTDRLESELKNVFRGLSLSEIQGKIEEVATQLKDKTLFVEHYGKIFEHIAVFQGLKKRSIEAPLATEEEYDLGIYTEGLESQVRDAVLLLAKKGYKTFESGFREKTGDRDQYIGMYNQSAELPLAIRNYFREKGFLVSLVHYDDRSVINIHPEKGDAISLEEWKGIWDDLAERLPEAPAEDFTNSKIYLLHKDFRKRQDALREVLG